MNSKKLVAIGLRLHPLRCLCAPARPTLAGTTEGETTASTVIADSNNDGQIDVGTVEDVEVNQASEHLERRRGLRLRQLGSAFRSHRDRGPCHRYGKL